MNKIIVHISEVDISQNGGMARVEFFLKKAFEEKGYGFVHIGPAEVGNCVHKALFPYYAFWYFKKLKVNPTALIVHEPLSGVFVKLGYKCFLESHGIERRSWDLIKNISNIKSKILYPLWRLRNCDIGLKYSDKLLLINSEDKKYVMDVYNRTENDIFVFKNGVYKFLKFERKVKEKKFTILFNGSWIERKGKNVLIESAKILYNRGYFNLNYLLIGTGLSVQDVLSDWPEYLKDNVTVIPKFDSTEEFNFIALANLFVLPSSYEGQPLSLLQAMSLGICCITTNICGQKDIIKNGENGFLFNVGDYVDLAKKIEYCYLNPLKTSMVEQLSKSSMSLRDWDTVSSEIVDFIEFNL